MKNTDVYLDLPKGVKWFQGVSINHPLGFLWHPLEGAGMYIIYIYILMDSGWNTKFRWLSVSKFSFFFKKNTLSHGMSWSSSWTKPLRLRSHWTVALHRKPWYILGSKLEKVPGVVRDISTRYPSKWTVSWLPAVSPWGSELEPGVI